MIRQYELVERVRAYDPGVDEDALNRAYVFAMKAHGSQKRASGDPYFSHPLEVAGILTSLRLDGASIVTALLHDLVEDTEVTLEQVEKLFGAEIAKLVDGVTKLSRIELQSGDQANQQAENFRKLVLAMSEDIRVLLVKLADRLHNMRTLHFVKDAPKRRRSALAFRLCLDLAELGHSIDQPGDILAEQLFNLVRGGERVLDGVVEDRRGDRLVVELQVGQDSRNLDRVAEIGVARGAQLRTVRLHREDVGTVDQPLIRIGIVGADLLDQLILSQHEPKMGE